MFDGWTAHERAVNLDAVERKTLQVAERRVAGAEVVHHEAHAKLLQLLKLCDGGLRVLHDKAFGEFNVIVRRGPAAEMKVVRENIPPLPAELKQIIEEQQK